MGIGRGRGNEGRDGEETPYQWKNCSHVHGWTDKFCRLFISGDVNAQQPADATDVSRLFYASSSAVVSIPLSFSFTFGKHGLPNTRSLTNFTGSPTSRPVSVSASLLSLVVGHTRLFNHRQSGFSGCCFPTVEHSATERYVGTITVLQKTSAKVMFENQKQSRENVEKEIFFRQISILEIV